MVDHYIILVAINHELQFIGSTPESRIFRALNSSAKNYKP